MKMVATLILFGATGDLAARMLLPSLYGLDRDGLLPTALRIVATARSAHDDGGFREHARAALDAHVPAAFSTRRRPRRSLGC
jgi:glucose-6-phosphate 1-dehydrogenase